MTQFVKDVIAQGRWDEAERAVLELARKYPSSSEPGAMLERLGRNEEIRAAQPPADARRDSAVRQPAALAGGPWRRPGRFVETFPTGPDTDALKGQLPTLEANAEIQSRQTLERYIKQYIQKQQYWDALALARRILNEYPLSPQANALRGQIARLEELARRQAPTA